MTARLVDMHLHLDFVEHPGELAAAAEDIGLSMLAVSVTPAGWRSLLGEVAGRANVRPAVGLHPWWVADGRAGEAELGQLEEAVATTRLVGEVGLDFSPGHVPAGSEAMQLAAFERVCRASAEASGAGGPRLLSIHSVRAAGTTLDVLERTGAARACHCVFHWFSGSSDELWRAIRAGCWFSVNERMLSGGRGREYAKVIPRDRLLLETDHPAGQGVPWDVDKVTRSLEATLARLEAVLGRDVSEEVATNALGLLAQPMR